MSIPISHDDLKLLVEVGMLAATRGEITAAKAIFSAIEHVRPEAAASYAGPAVAYLFRGRPADAAEQLRRGLAKVPPDDRQPLQVLLGLALQLDACNAESLKVLRGAGDHPIAAALLADSHAAPAPL